MSELALVAFPLQLSLRNKWSLLNVSGVWVEVGLLMSLVLLLLLLLLLLCHPKGPP
jgi:hypothetical protein